MSVGLAIYTSLPANSAIDSRYRTPSICFQLARAIELRASAGLGEAHDGDRDQPIAPLRSVSNTVCTNVVSTTSSWYSIGQTTLAQSDIASTTTAI